MPLKVNRTFKGETSSTGEDKREVWMYDVHAEDLTFTVTQAKTADDGTTAIPAKGDVHPADPDMICFSIDASRDEGLPTLIRVTVTWQSPKLPNTSSSGGGETGETPIWGIDLAFDRETYQEVVNVDLDGKPIVNSAGDPFENVVRKGTDAVYIYSYFVKNLDWVKMGEVHGGVNDDDVVLNFNGRTKTFAKHTLMIEPRFYVDDTLTPETEGGTPPMVYKVECRLTHKSTGWFGRYIDQGFNAFPESEDESVFFPSQVCDKGQPRTDPTMLDGTGKVLEAGAEVVLFPTPTDADRPDGYRLVAVVDFTELPGFGG